MESSYKIIPDIRGGQRIKPEFSCRLEVGWSFSQRSVLMMEPWLHSLTRLSLRVCIRQPSLCTKSFSFVVSAIIQKPARGPKITWLPSLRCSNRSIRWDCISSAGNDYSTLTNFDVPYRRMTLRSFRLRSVIWRRLWCVKGSEYGIIVTTKDVDNGML